MRAFDVLLALHRLDMRQGKDYLEAPKKNDLELNVIEGDYLLIGNLIAVLMFLNMLQPKDIVMLSLSYLN